jgi:cAMP-dependent protein kinase regulator
MSGDEVDEGRAAKRRKTAKSPSPSPDRMPSPSRWRKRRRFSVSAEADGGPAPPLPAAPPVGKKSLSEEVADRVRLALKNVFLCAHLDSEQLQSIVESMEEVHVSAGTDVVVEGDEGDYFYLIDSGVFHVFKTPERKKVYEYNHSGSFGELALMYNCPRAATVHAITDGVLFRVDRATFRHIIVTSQIQKRALYEGFLSNVMVFSKFFSLVNLFVEGCFRFRELESFRARSSFGLHL